MVDDPMGRKAESHIFPPHMYIIIVQNFLNESGDIIYLGGTCDQAPQGGGGGPVIRTA